MNSDFKETAFAENEQAALINHSETGDSVFALSKPEMDAFNAQLTENGFDSLAIDAVWKSSNTDFLAMSLRDAGIAEPNTGWWLRSNGLFNFMAYFINWNGGQDYRNVDEKDENGRTMARPCVYLDLSKTDCWSYAGTVSSDGNVNEVEKEPEIIDGEYFSGEKNGWPFANSEEGLGINKHLHHHQFKTLLSKTGLDNLVSMATLQWLASYEMILGFGGDCFGLSLSSAAVYTNKYDVSKFFSSNYEDSKTLNQYGYQGIMKTQDDSQYDYYTIKGNEEALQFIEGLQLLQSSKEFKENYEVFKDDSLNDIIQYFNNPNDKRIILACIKNGGGHATIIDKSKPLEKNGDLYAIPLYDCNYPSDSQNLLQNPISKSYGYQSYLVINPVMDKYAKFVYNYKDDCYAITTDFHSKDDWSYGAEFFDVSDVDEKFFSDRNEELYRKIFQNTLFIDGKKFFSLSDMINGKIAEIQNGVIKEYNESLCDLDKYISYSDENMAPYILKVDNYNTKDIIVEDGAIFLIEDNAIYCVNVEGKAELKLDTENTGIWFKSLQDGSKINCNLQANLSTDYKDINVKTILDNNEELTIQNKEGTLTIDAPEGKRGDVQLDNAGDIVNKENILLKELNGYKIGDKQKEDENHGSEIGDGTDKNNKNDEKSSGSGKNATINLASKAVTNNKNASPDTGDHQNMIFWIVAFAGSLIFMGSSIKKLRKKKRS